VKVFRSDAPRDEQRVIIRRHDGDVEMVELTWRLRPLDAGKCAVNVLRSVILIALNELVAEGFVTS
jgi:hypothetical protein